MTLESLEKKSSAITLSDMEIFIFPELLFALVLANILSPRLWAWRDDPWFAGIRDMNPKKRLQRIRQYIMDHYVFNLDLDTWGMTTQERELARFKDVLSPDAIAQSNALFGYHGDSYYYDIDIRAHFGLDKYGSDVIPYWKTETIEAMDAFQFRDGFTAGAGECVSLSALYAASLFVVAGIPLDKIYLMATPLHSQNFIDVSDGILTNNRRLVTKAMWFNGTPIAMQARRALDNERVTIISHVTGHIHTLYRDATIAPDVYATFSKKLRAFLDCPITPERRAEFEAWHVDLCPEKRNALMTRFYHTDPRLPLTDGITWHTTPAPFAITQDMTRDDLLAHLSERRAMNPVADLAFYAFRDLSLTDAAPFIKAAIERNPVSRTASENKSDDDVCAAVHAMINESIYDGNRMAQPDEAWHAARGDGLEKAILLGNILKPRHAQSNWRIHIAEEHATLTCDNTTIATFATKKHPRDTDWTL